MVGRGVVKGSAGRIGLRGWGIAAVFLALLPLGRVPGEPGEKKIHDYVARGKDLYRIYCQDCHGEAGKGDGPTARVLVVKPADLTGISARNGGAFPFDKVLRRIDGRQDIPAHVAREMPIWGIVLQEWDKDTDQRDEIAGRLLHLTYYVKFLQVAAE